MLSDDKDLRDVQNEALSIYKSFADICSALGLRYYAASGTLIGAILYQGFIPWDDDLDINMPRKDYERFKREAPNLLPPYLSIFDGLTSSHADYHFIKLHDKRTTYTANQLLRFPDCYTGAFIDIEPIDGVPDDQQARECWYKTIEQLYCYDLIRKFGKTYMYPDTIAWLQPNRFKRALVYAWIQMHPLRFYANRYMTMQTDMNSRCDFDQSTYVSWPRYGMYRSRNYWKTLKSSWDTYSEVPFEDSIIRVPDGYENILTSQYGFMPTNETQERYEREQQDSHHIVNALVDLNRPYTYYQECQ